MKPGPVWMRHGTSDDGLCRPGAHARPHSPLTIGGMIEAEQTARRFRDHHRQPVLITSSPLRRARETASIMAEVLSARLVPPVAVFAEWRAPHCVLGRTATQYPPDYLIWREQRAHAPDTALPGGESLRAFVARALDADTLARDLAAEHGPVLIVSHRLLIGAVAALHAGHRRPADVFGYASHLRLSPAQPWTSQLRGHA